jgi:transcriptional regulator with XRE-family HTH domain
MTKPDSRPYSRYSRDAAQLLGRLIRRARIEQGLTAEALAERAGISRGLVQRIEKGEMGCAIGAVFEVAAIVGVPLFEASPAELASRVAEAEYTLRLLPRSVRTSDKDVKDDF